MDHTGVPGGGDRKITLLPPLGVYLSGAGDYLRDLTGPFQLKKSL